MVGKLDCGWCCREALWEICRFRRALLIWLLVHGIWHVAEKEFVHVEGFVGTGVWVS